MLDVQGSCASPGAQSQTVLGGLLFPLAALTRRAATTAAASSVLRKLVVILEREVGTANGSGQLRLLSRELELRCELRGDLHPFGELEPDRPLRRIVDGVHH